MVFKRGVYIVAARRTPFGRFGGKLTDYTATDLQTIANRAVFKQVSLSPEVVDSVIVGNVFQTSTYAIFLPRHAALAAGVPVHVPFITVNRMCGSGFQSLVSGGQEIELGDSNVVLCGGAENMSQSPFVLRGARFGTKLGQENKLEDTLWAALTDGYVNTSMAMTGKRKKERKPSEDISRSFQRKI